MWESSLSLATVPVPHLFLIYYSPSPFPAKALCKQHARLCKPPEDGISKVGILGCPPTVLLSHFYHQENKKSGEEKKKVQTYWLFDLFNSLNILFLKKFKLFFVITKVITYEGRKNILKKGKEKNLKCDFMPRFT